MQVCMHLYTYTSCSVRAAAVSRGTSYFNTKLIQNVVITGNVNKLDRKINKSCIAPTCESGPKSRNGIAKSEIRNNSLVRAGRASTVAYF